MAQNRLGFSKDNALFVDDTIEVLRVARQYGLRNVIQKARASSKEEPIRHAEFPSIFDFDELLD